MYDSCGDSHNQTKKCTNQVNAPDQFDLQLRPLRISTSLIIIGYTDHNWKSQLIFNKRNDNQSIYDELLI